MAKSFTARWYLWSFIVTQVLIGTADAFPQLHVTTRRPGQGRTTTTSFQRVHRQEDPKGCPEDSHEVDKDRRTLIQSAIAGILTVPLGASAGKPELDISGELFTPKSQMLSGGSDMTRGISLAEKPPIGLKPGQSVQSTYETRFIAYLSRFLLTFDPAAHTWWVKQGFEDSWDPRFLGIDDEQRKLAELKFAEFAESVEVGLSDYFQAPYGSYASVEAAKAGLKATGQATSSGMRQEESPAQVSRRREKRSAIATAIEERQQQQGILNLYCLLKARYTARAAKKQLAILFSMISSPSLQPVNEIKSLLGEIDNATITRVEFASPTRGDMRTSSRTGGGYSIREKPKITVDSPPALGADFRPAKMEAIMKPTSRILRIKVLDGGSGYTSVPAVRIVQSLLNIGAATCEAAAILNRKGGVESIIVLDPGRGYNLGPMMSGRPPNIYIEPPRGGPSKQRRKAKAVVELEYEIVGIKVVDGGSGYCASEFPSIQIDLPADDPDWFVETESYKPASQLDQAPGLGLVTATATEMRLGDESIVTNTVDSTKVSNGVISRLKRDPLELIPSSVRPELVDSFKGLSYSIPSLPAVKASVPVPSARYRAFDPIFGPIGRVPVTKGALALSPSEYSRLALSGALCTVLVRTALNPLELVKTKIQLSNDKELNEFVSKEMKERNSVPKVDAPKTASSYSEPSIGSGGSPSTTATLVDPTTMVESTTIDTQEEVEQAGTKDVMLSLVKLRGVGALFQSADITFLASVMFGSFGFGATELFRRYFTSEFFPAEGGTQTGEEIILLVAAAVACVLTSLAAAPFEVLRVKSMGLVQAKPWKEVLEISLKSKNSGYTPEDFKPKDLLPLWGGFAPTLSRELPFAIIKFLVFDVLAREIAFLVNSNFLGEGAIPVQVGVGTAGLVISAISGAFAGVAGAIVSHPADLVLTLTSNSNDGEEVDWREAVKELLSRDGGIANLFIGLPARSTFFFLVIGLQFFLYDYVKNIFQVGSDDLSLILDVFYAVRQGLVDMNS